MKIPFVKYHALANDFLVIEAAQVRVPKARLGRLARTICNRRSGVGADGILFLSTYRGNRRVDVYNADGSWAEKSGNGLRIAAMHEYLKNRRRRRFEIIMNDQMHQAQVLEGFDNGALITTQLGSPTFETKRIPMKGKRRVMINAPLKVGGVQFPVTCLAVGNPHAVLPVDDFDFDWQTLGAEIETHPSFPRGTNVEFVRVVSRRRIDLADWERGAGATGSSGTGAAAAVCAMVMLGAVERECAVYFDTGNLKVHWRRESDLIELTGPVDYIAKGEFVSP
ncbi:MAG: diaminopimelate epimerase [candidate division Zixibacteria bacterium]|nr:diaminopimelate epimerase [candidate division Zixibacteria bacterium]MDH3935792.1 diaminopimelate epimerase [candidate division Zixibacteria bacterium]MDH4034636.1 diaminopimelate epimerase [candidate division Zixibacteria bacterium]